jgi:hypothetical protein
MKRILLLVASLVLVAGPALAQPGGLPAVQAQIKALQEQNALLQRQVSGLRVSVDGLRVSVGDLQTRLDELASGAVDDGTAEAIVGTWSGSGNSVIFDRSTKFTAPGSPPQTAQFFSIFGGTPPGLTSAFAVPILGPCVGGPGACQTGTMMVGVNPEFWVVRGGTDPDEIAFTLARDGLKLSGTVSQGGLEIGTLSGIVLSNNFFLLRARVPATGPCAGNGVVVFQGTGSLSLDRTRMLVTGSAVEADCQHTVFRLGLSK